MEHFHNLLMAAQMINLEKDVRVVASQTALIFDK